MNEHIKLLKEQAMEWVPNMADPDTKIRLLNAEKFAELIVRECAGLMDGRRIEYGNCKDGRVILKHFGVEE
jgi:hypothetical protein